MQPRVLPPTSPGEMLHHFLEEYGLTQVQLAKHLDWTTTKVNQLVRDKLSITPETALCLSDAFGNSAEFWLNGQKNWDLWHATQKHEHKPRIAS